jgi:predicted phosphodiesterase
MTLSRRSSGAISSRMRIVVVADTHTFEKDQGALPDGDVFVHAGDLLRNGTLAELSSVAGWIRALPHRHKVVVAGNHDWCVLTQPESARALLGDATYLEDSETTIHAVRFWGSPWQPAYNDWAFNLPRGWPLAEKWAAIPNGVGILITHGPPLGFGDKGPSAGRMRGPSAVCPQGAALLHLFGHIHQDGGFWRNESIAFANVTTWECERPPTVLDIDLSTKEVMPVIVPPPAAPRSPQDRHGSQT